MLTEQWTKIVKSAQKKPKELNKRHVSSIQEEDNKMEMYKLHNSQKQLQFTSFSSLIALK